MARRRRDSGNVALLLMFGIAGFVVLGPAVRFARGNLVAVIAAIVGLVAAAVALAVLWKSRIRRRRELEDKRLRAVLPFHNMNDKQFEHALASLCRDSGCRQVEVSGGSGDHGADVVALTPDGRRLILQAKRYNITRRVGDKEMQQLVGGLMTWHQFDIAALVATASFTAPARATAARNGIRLIDNRALAAWNSGTGPAPWD
ncbi:restriction endonuclease [Nocardia abscessus]|uniref:restriction endonuclease n=1 Tax=Nocardia abscessus TaxID=120957 RepID=UPI00189489E2|nr:restriction endonuclease [Nocardia abscessus]MBF6338484.1 restriction endonuclease [Nocardia abscessus]